VEYDQVGRCGITSFSDLRAKVTRALERLQQTPAIVQAFFRDPDLQYATPDEDHKLKLLLSGLVCELRA